MKLFSVLLWEIVMGTFYFVVTFCIILIYHGKHSHTQPCMQSMKTFTVLIGKKHTLAHGSSSQSRATLLLLL